MNKFETQLRMVQERIFNYADYLKMCERGGDWKLDEFMQALSAHVTDLRGMLINEQSAPSGDLILLSSKRLDDLVQIEKYYNCVKTFDSFTAKVFFDVIAIDERNFDQLMDEHIAITNIPKEYYLLQELPFLRFGTIFCEYTMKPETMEFYADGDDENIGTLFSSHENAILRSIVEDPEWVRKC